MFFNYLTIAIRNIKKFKVFSAINITGLSISLAVVIIILSYAEMELDTNKFHKNYNHIYKIGKECTPAPLADLLKSNIPEIQRTARIDYMNTGSVSIKYGSNDPLTLKNLIFSDPDFFNIFSFYSLKGNLQKALSEPMTMAITESEAKRIFGNENPIDKTIKLDNEFELTIKAVMHDIPQNSSMKFCGVVSFQSLKIMRGHPDFDPFRWSNNDFETYIMISGNFNIKDIFKKIELVLLKKLPEACKELNTDIYQFNKIYYNPEISNYHTHGSINRSFLLVSVAVLILLIAVINFINLSTARASARTKEIGIRKTIGAARFSLIKQFLTESVVISFISMIIAVFLASELSFLFNQLIDFQITVFNGSVFNKTIILLCSALILGILAGLYPAFYLSSFNPGIILRDQIHHQKGRVFLRKVLTMLQFSVTIALIASVIVIYNQLQYIKNKPLGFQKGNIIYFTANRQVFEKKNLLKDKILQIPEVNSFAYSSLLPGEKPLIWKHTLQYEGKETNIIYAIAPVSRDYINLMRMKIAAGRNFYVNDRNDEFNLIINESFAKKYVLKEPFKAKIKDIMGNGSIVGVVKDFNFESLRSGVEPLVFLNVPDWFSYGVIKLKSMKYNNINGMIHKLESIWKDVSPDFPLEYHFLDENLDLQYKAEERFQKSFIYFSFLAVFISCLGLFGLVLFVTEQKTKEVGIRKILGASAGNIIIMLSKQFIVLVLLSNIIAWPVSFLIMKSWLADFAYQAPVKWWVFALSGLAGLLVALLTILYQATKTAVANPAESLKYE